MSVGILTEIGGSLSVIWTNTQGVQFINTDSVSWTSSKTTRVSTEAFADAHYWDDYIISFTPPQYTTSTTYGGYCALSFGDIEISLDLFSSLVAAGNSTWVDADISWISDDTVWHSDAVYGNQVNLWPIPSEMFIKQRFTLSDESSSSILFDGTMYLQSYDRESARFDLYGESLDQDLLDEVVDYDGNTTAIPRAFGTIQYCVPLRLPDSGGYPVYHNGYLSGKKGVDWHVYDDGVNIDSNAFDNGDYTFYLDASPVGEVTVSGTGVQTTLSEIMDWACNSVRFGLVYNYDSGIEENPSPSIVHWANSQRKLIDFLSDVAAFFNHLFYFTATNCYLVDMTKDNGSRTLTEFDYFAAPSYGCDPPVALLKSEWVIRDAVEETIGKYVKDTDYKCEVTSQFPYGSEDSITPYHTDINIIKSRLTAIVTNRLKKRISLSIPVSDDLPVPGESITFSDNSFKSPLDVVMRCRSIRYDLQTDSIEIQGEGTIT